MDLFMLSKIAVEAAISAGKIIQKYMKEDISVEEKVGGSSYASQVVTKVDKECEAEILSYLTASCIDYNIALLSEETDDDESRLEKDYFWCIDPMDGTLAFINKQPGFSVSIALIAKDGTPCIGVVYNPSSDIVYSAIKGSGAFKNGIPWRINNSNNLLTYATDRKLIDTARAEEIKMLLNKGVERLGLDGIKEISGAGAVLNGIIVLENGPACMMKMPKKEDGGGSIWDYAAIACIYKELGLPATDFNGDRLNLNRKDGTFMNQTGIYFANLS